MKKQLHMTKNKWFKAFICLIALFVGYNIFWFCITTNKYKQFTSGMEKTFGGRIEQIYNNAYDSSENGYIYNVKFPGYLHYTGNLAIASEDGAYCIIIWPSFLGETQYGVMLETEKENYQIMVDQDMVALDPNMQTVIDKYENELLNLSEKAKIKWNL